MGLKLLIFSLVLASMTNPACAIHAISFDLSKACVHLTGYLASFVHDDVLTIGV